jgi:nicotinamidase-related amidase
MRALDLEALIIGGIVTNGGVASTVRDAHLRNVETILLSDGAAAFNAEVHDATLLSLGTVTKVMTCAETVALVEGTQ